MLNVSAEICKRNELQSVVIGSLSSLIESRDENTGEHVLRTRDYVGLLAREMERDEAFRGQLNADLIEEIQNAAPLHDIGKIAVSDTRWGPPPSSPSSASCTESKRPSGACVSPICS